jgi:hypothetical protein
MGERRKLAGLVVGELARAVSSPNLPHDFIKRVPARAADRGRVVRPQHMPSSFLLKDMTARTAGTAFSVSARINLANWSALA